MNLVYSLVGTTKTFYIFNGHGDVIALTNNVGTITRTYEYDAFGVEDEPSVYDTNPFRYCGEYYDTETKTLYLRARYYDASTGRFTAEDPIKDGANWYSYCGGNPVNFVDPMGLTKFEMECLGPSNDSLLAQRAMLNAGAAVIMTIAIAGMMESFPITPPHTGRETYPQTEPKEVAFDNPVTDIDVSDATKAIDITADKVAEKDIEIKNSIYQVAYVDKNSDLLVTLLPSFTREEMLAIMITYVENPVFPNNVSKRFFGVYTQFQADALLLTKEYDMLYGSLGYYLPEIDNMNGRYYHYHTYDRNFHIWYGTLTNN